MEVGFYLPDVIMFLVGLGLMFTSFIVFVSGFGVGIPGKRQEIAFGISPYVLYIGAILTIAGVIIQAGHWFHL